MLCHKPCLGEAGVSVELSRKPCFLRRRRSTVFLEDAVVSFLRGMSSAMVQAVFPVRAFSSLDGYWPTFMLIAYGEPHEQPESYSSVG